MSAPPEGPAKDAIEAYQQFTAALEIIRDDIRGFSDGQKGMASDVAGMKVHLRSLDERTERLESDVHQVNHHLRSLDERTGRLESDVHQVKHHLALNGVPKKPKKK